MSLTPPSSHGNATSISGVTVSGTPTTGEALTATSASTADWEAPGGGSSGELLAGLGAGFGNLQNTGALTSSGNGYAAVTGVPFLIAAMGAVCEVAAAVPADVPDLSDDLDCSATLYVTDAAGTNTLTVTAGNSQGTPISGVGTSIDWTGSSPTIVGADLTWDDASATVTSTAGGVYSAILIVTCLPD